MLDQTNDFVPWNDIIYDPKACLEHMIEHGFLPDLMPIVPPDGEITTQYQTSLRPGNLGKIPGKRLDDGSWCGFTDWSTMIATEELAEVWASWLNVGIGLNCRRMLAVDIDVTDEPLAVELEQLAYKLLGQAPRRIGNPPKRLLLYRSAIPLSKARTSFHSPEGEAHAIDYLAKGELFVAGGIHAKTLEPYAWAGLQLLDFERLTVVTREKLQAYIEAAEKLILERGFIVQKSASAAAAAEREARKHTGPRDLPENIEAAKARLKALVDFGRVAIDGSHEADDTTFEIGCELTHDLGLMPETAIALMDELWVPHCQPSNDATRALVRKCVMSAENSGQNDPPLPEPPASERFKAAVENLNGAEQEEPPPKKERLFPFIYVGQFRKQPRPKVLIDTLMYAKTVHVDHGPNQTFKSFTTVEELTAIATGLDAFGHYPVYQTGDVVYFAAEDPSDLMAIRCPALWKARGLTVHADGQHLILPNGSTSPGRFILVPKVPLVGKGEYLKAIDEMVDEGIKPLAVCIDTAGKSCVAEDQNTDQVVGMLVYGAENMRDKFGCTVKILHHPSKGNPHQPKGSAAYSDDTDIVTESIRTAGTYDLVKRFHKRRSGGGLPPDQYFRGRLIGVEGEDGEPLRDDRGNVVTCPVFDHVEAPSAKRDPGPIDPATAKWRALREMIHDAVLKIVNRYKGTRPSYLGVDDVVREIVKWEHKKETPEAHDANPVRSLKKDINEGFHDTRGKDPKCGPLSDWARLDELGKPMKGREYQFDVDKVLPPDEDF